MKKTAILLGIMLLSVFVVKTTSAHVVVEPSTAESASFQTFTVGVPTEKDSPTVGLRLIIPGGVKEVTPNVKPGWQIEVKKTGAGEDAVVSEIDWTGGSIPAGQRDDFSFSTQVPAKETTLIWKAYQTYEDGSFVSWNQAPGQIKKGEEGTPYSQTKVMDVKPPSQPEEKDSNWSLDFSLVAFVLSVVAITMQQRKK